MYFKNNINIKFSHEYNNKFKFRSKNQPWTIFSSYAQHLRPKVIKTMQKSYVKILLKDETSHKKKNKNERVKEVSKEIGIHIK